MNGDERQADGVGKRGGRKPMRPAAGHDGRGAGGAGSGGRAERSSHGRPERGGFGGKDAADRPFRPPRPPRPARPPLPEERPRLGRDAWRNLKASAPAGTLDDLAKAFGAAGEALDSGDLDRAVSLLEWAKAVAPRSAAVREALGVVRYQRGDFPAASSELLTYRRLSGRHDQNHLLADCARAAGRADKVDEHVEEMITAGVDPERVAEGLLVQAGARADRGDVHGAMRALQRADLDPLDVRPWHPRLWWFAAELSERAGDLEAARDYLEAILAVADDEEVEERLRGLDER